jgi:magnesium transporter
MRTAADLMTKAVPRARPIETAGGALAALREQPLGEASHLYLVDEESRLLGQVPVEALLAALPETGLDGLRGDPPVEVRPEDNAEAIALLAVERHDADVAVIGAGRELLGAIPIGRLLALLHEEHVDNVLRLGGVGTAHPAPTRVHETLRAFRARVPWLALGLLGGMLAGGVASLFESSLKREITLAFFLPLVVYMADAIGTQTETVLVRRLAYGQVSLATQIRREGVLGLLIGATIGAIAWAGLWAWGAGGAVAVIVGLAVAASAVVATLVASLLPWCLAALGADPALGSGPIATVLQDLLSVAIYLGIATALL